MVTPSIAPSLVGILPLLNSGAALQSKPVDGVFFGARFVPLICIHVFTAMSSDPKAVFTEVMMGAPGAAETIVPVPVTLMVSSLLNTVVALIDPVAPA